MTALVGNAIGAKQADEAYSGSAGIGFGVMLTVLAIIAWFAVRN